MFSSLKKKDDIDEEIQFLGTKVKSKKKAFPVRVSEDNSIEIGLPDNHVKLTLHRTLRIPDDGKVYPLPPSLGKFPICKVDDYKNTVPKKWLKHGGLFFPMYQREAMWIAFNSHNSHGTRPKAVKIAIGKINVITGKPWKNALNKKKQDYAVLPMQKWLDGINNGSGSIKQFIAMPLGKGYTVEGQVTGSETFGGIQVCVYDNKVIYPPKKKIIKIKPKITYPQVCNNQMYGDYDDEEESYKMSKKIHYKKKKNYSSSAPKRGKPSMEKSMNEQQQEISFHQQPSMNLESVNMMYKEEEPSAPDVDIDVIKSVENDEDESSEMGLGVGGLMKQKIYVDKYGHKSWDHKNFGRTYIHIVNSKMFELITGKKPPECPISAQTYETYGFPYYDIYDEKKNTIKKSNVLSKIKSVKQVDHNKYGYSQQDDSSVKISNVNTLDPDDVRDGDW